MFKFQVDNDEHDYSEDIFKQKVNKIRQGKIDKIHKPKNIVFI